MLRSFAYSMTRRQNSIFCSMVSCLTTSWSASIAGVTMPVVRVE